MNISFNFLLPNKENVKAIFTANLYYITFIKSKYDVINSKRNESLRMYTAFSVKLLLINAFKFIQWGVRERTNAVPK